MPKIKVAKLREDGLFLGLEEIEEEELTEGHVHKAVANGTDLEPGRYRWVTSGNEYGGEFVPLENINKTATQLQGNATAALYALVLQMMEHKLITELPVATAQWMAHYSRTVDARGLPLRNKK